MDKSKDERKLTSKEETFVDEYLEDFNGTRAYRAAYGDNMTYKCARSSAARLLKKEHIVKEIDRRRKELREEHNLYLENLIEQLKRIAFSNYRHVGEVKKNVVIIHDTDDLDNNQWAAVKSIKEGKNGIEIEFYDKMKAIELLGKYLGLFRDKVDLNGDIKYDFSMLEGLSLEELNKIAGVGEWDSLPKGDEKDG